MTLGREGGGGDGRDEEALGQEEIPGKISRCDVILFLANKVYI